MRVRLTITILILIFLVAFSALGLSADTDNKVGFIYDGELIKWNEAEFGSIQIMNSRTLIPLRIISESLGLKVSWDDENKAALVRYRGELYRFPVGRNVVITPAETKYMDADNSIIEGRIHLPLRSFFELIGSEVEWKSNAKVAVSSKKTGELLSHDSYVMVKKPVHATDDKFLSRARSTEDRYMTTDEIDTLDRQENIDRLAVDVAAKPEPAPVPQQDSQTIIRNNIYALYNKYPEGMYWGADHCYVWTGNHAYNGYDGCGCVGFALEFSDAIFGVNAPVTMIEDFSNIENTIRVGDIISVDYGGHQVVVKDVLDYGVSVVEGNYVSSVHWNRVYTFDELREVGTFYFTRY